MKRSQFVFAPILTIALALSSACDSGTLTVTQDGPEAMEEASPADDVVEPVLDFECSPTMDPVGAPMRRLSRSQLENTVEELVRTSMGDVALAEDVLQGVQTSLEKFPTNQKVRPPGERRGGFTRLDHSVQQTHVDAGIELAERLGRSMTDSPEELRALMGPCATDDDLENDSACLRDFIESFGRLAARRPLSSDDVAFYESIHESQTIDAAQVGAIIGVMVSSPQGLYHVELAPEGSTVLPGETWELGPHELASRLSYLFWQAPPDAELRRLADDGSLLDDEVFRAQVERVFNDPRTDATVRTFFGEWLRLDELEDPVGSTDSTIYRDFAGDDLPDEAFLDAVVDDVEKMGSWHTMEAGSSFREMFLSNHSFATEDSLAAIYGVEPWDGVSAPPMMPAGERHGLITRVAFLMDRWLLTRPVVKGLFVREALLCTVLPPPDEQDAAMGFELRADMTAREQLVAVTEQEGTDCAACHVPYINGLGFATEGYDTLGRVRAEERLYDPLEERFVGTRPVDTHSIPRIVPNDLRSSSGAGDLAAMLVESKQMEACFARQYLRFATGRLEDVRGDGCALADLYDQLLAGESLADVMMSVALRPEFRRRTVAATTEGAER